MKTGLLLLSLFTGLILASCGGSQSGEDSLEQLIMKRDELKKELTLLNEKIAALDTAEVDMTPIVTSAMIEQKDFVHKVEVQGAVETDENVLVTAESQGTIRAIHVKEGQRVSKGQPLITIDSEILASTIDEVETSLEMANYMFEKQQKLMDEGVGVEIEYEQSRNQKKSIGTKIKNHAFTTGKNSCSSSVCWCN
ncbi:MAG: biotin/lipoyl-binding protein [Crocinitomicaceae bacterium]|nr:biotin/lipoyl-binding protein [Crocinitomicaceae bacterium]